MLISARAALASTYAMIELPLPFMYTHCVYWVVEVLLITLSIESGITLAVMYERKDNGDERYQYNDPNTPWPKDPYRWYFNVAIRELVGNIIFILLTLGLLKFCERIENPLLLKSAAFPESLYDVAMHNNIRAFAGAYRNFTQFVDKKESGHLLSPIAASSVVAAASMTTSALTLGGYSSVDIRPALGSMGNSAGVIDWLSLRDQNLARLSVDELVSLMLSRGSFMEPYAKLVEV